MTNIIIFKIYIIIKIKSLKCIKYKHLKNSLGVISLKKKINRFSKRNLLNDYSKIIYFTCLKVFGNYSKFYI